MQRSSRPEMFCKSIVLKNFTKFTRKHLCQNLFLNKVTGLSRSINKETLTQAFSCEFWEKNRERPKAGHYFRISSIVDFWQDHTPMLIALLLFWLVSKQTKKMHFLCKTAGCIYSKWFKKDKYFEFLSN